MGIVSFSGRRNVKAGELFAGLCQADYRHDGGIRCLRRFRLEPDYFAQLRADIERLCRTEQGSDATQPGHITYWTRPRGTVTQFSLLNMTGRYDDYSTDHNLSCLRKSFHGQAAYPVLAGFVSAFPHAVNFQVNVMGPGAQLGAHEENLIIRTRNGKVGSRLRFHLPVVTNPASEITLDGWVFSLSAGTIYLINHGCVHTAHNGGSQSRIHLVFDLLLTRAVFDCLFGDAPPPLPLTVVDEDNEEVTPRRVEPVSPHVKLPPLVAPGDLVHLGWCDVQ